MIGPSILLVYLVLGTIFLHLVTGGGIDVGNLCGEQKIQCMCGRNNGYPILLDVKECMFFYRFKPECKPCDGVKTEVRCQPFIHCQECDDLAGHCSRCPPNRFGSRCNLECTCQNGGSCEQHTGRCICHLPFHGPQCEFSANCFPPMPPKNGIYEPQLTQYKAGDQLKFSCDSNHFLEGPSVLQCLNQGGWNTDPPKCKSECPLVVNPLNGTVDLPDGRLVEGVKLRYSCNDGYRLKGEAERLCQGNGSWSGDDPVCERYITCKSIEELEHGEHEIQFKDSEIDFLSETSVNFMCNEGFVVVGAENIWCQNDGVWSDEPPVCVEKEKTCRHPVPPADGSITLHGKGGKQGVLHGVVIQYSCAPLHYMVGNENSTCLNNSKWSSRRPRCQKIITCNSVETLVHGKVNILKPAENKAPKRVENSTTGMSSRVGHRPRFSMVARNAVNEAQEAIVKTELPEGHYHVGTRAVYSCESRYYDLIGSGTRMCMNNGLWSGRQHTCYPVCGRSSGPRRSSIVGGFVSEFGQWPWQVAIAQVLDSDDPRGPWHIYCGGALLSEIWFVTAAHCLMFPGTKNLIPLVGLQVYLGKHFRNDSLDDSGVQVRKIDETIIHPNYEPSPSLEADIALVRLSEPVRFTSRVQIVCLPSFDIDQSLYRLAEGNEGVVSGWGKTETSNASDVLQYTEIPVVNNVKCEEEYRKAGLAVTVTRNMFCAGLDEGLRDSCSGDSGGPLVFPLDDRKDKWVLEGIVSWGSIRGCGKPRQYSAFTRVHRFIEWIKYYI